MAKKEQEREEANQEFFICKKCGDKYPVSQIGIKDGMKLCPECSNDYEKILKKD